MHHLSVLVWVAVSFAVSRCVELHTLSEVSAHCGDEVTLPCDASASGQLDIKLFSWLAKNRTVCEYKQNRTEPDIQCNSSSSNSSNSLTLIINRVMPVHNGMYICKLRSTAGTDSKQTVLTVKECIRSQPPSVTVSSQEKNSVKGQESGSHIRRICVLLQVVTVTFIMT
ncbi:titin-like [Parambassis ranga]|uniref:Titin-like n=1 Tax=Parambassis ranga TaxID=210632 RepID=A0A6P7IR68_9TELE|nr:titin-like [Parambassis ranga]